MTAGSFTIGGKEYVIVPRKEYELVAARLAEDARDVKLAKAAMRHYRKTGRGVTLDKLKRELEA